MSWYQINAIIAIIITRDVLSWRYEKIFEYDIHLLNFALRILFRLYKIITIAETEWKNDVINENLINLVSLLIMCIEFSSIFLNIYDNINNLNGSCLSNFPCM